MFVVPSFSRNAALFDCAAPFVVRVDLDNFTFASTLQDKVSAIRPPPPPPTAMRGRHIPGGNHTTILARKLFPISNPSFRMPPKRLLIFVAFEKSMEIILELLLEIPLQMLAEVGIKITFLTVGYFFGFFPVLFLTLCSIEPGPIRHCDDGGAFYRSQGMKYWHITYSCLLYTSPSPRD